MTQSETGQIRWESEILMTMPEGKDRTSYVDINLPAKNVRINF
jgi:hypothetical protein